VLPLSDIRGLVESVDGQRRSAVADTAAAAWSYGQGVARHHRSSASHVFALLADGAAAPCGYLRLVPAARRSRAHVEAVADHMRMLSDGGLPVVAPVPSASGALVETVATPLGDMHAIVVGAAEGEQVDVDGLTTARARAWGAALARLHHAGGAAVAGLPVAFSELSKWAAPAAFADDQPLAAAVGRLGARIGELPRDPVRFGVVHGDFELDNLAWRGEEPTVFDFDEAAPSWFVADVAYAVRDLDPPPSRTPSAGEAPLFGAFLAGYRDVGPLDEGDLALLPLFHAAHAAVALVRLASVVAPGHDGIAGADPGWLVTLRGRLDLYLRRQRAIVLHG
jgi:Ser/Thr protein kinase RdoA (MazF antagonist)